MSSALPCAFRDAPDPLDEWIILSKSLPFSVQARRRLVIGVAAALSVGAVCAATADAAASQQSAPPARFAATAHVNVNQGQKLTIPLPAGVALPAGLALPPGIAVVPAAAPVPQAPVDNSPRGVAHRIVPADQFASFDEIVTHESGWNTHAENPSGAYGLGQALPGGKMAAAGPDWRDNPETQIRWTYDYMNSRYGSPNAAWAFWQSHHWY